MELQERATIAEFMSGPLKENSTPIESNQTSNGIGNQILGYLLGFTPKLDVDDEPNEARD